MGFNLWDGVYVVVPTNGNVAVDGSAVMGKGLALQARQRYPELPRLLGARLKTEGNQVYEFECGAHMVLTFPTKHHWRDPADLALIEKSAIQLLRWAKTQPRAKERTIWVPRVGCGTDTGQLDWNVVKLILDRVFNALPPWVEFVYTHP